MANRRGSGGFDGDRRVGLGVRELVNFYRRWLVTRLAVASLDSNGGAAL